MDNAMHEALKQIPPEASRALYKVAFTHQLTVAFLIAHLVGRRVYAAVTPEQLAAAAEKVPAEVREAVRAATWPELCPPPWVVGLAGRQTEDLDAVEKALRGFVTDEDLPVRFEVQPGVWVMARHMGTQAAMRDAKPAPELVAAVLPLLVTPPPPTKLDEPATPAEQAAT